MLLFFHLFDFIIFTAMYVSANRHFKMIMPMATVTLLVTDIRFFYYIEYGEKAIDHRMFVGLDIYTNIVQVLFAFLMIFAEFVRRKS